ncbi:glutamyl-tRNA reductase [Anaerococcus hydrogenalis]|uniref:glutamyl-tRNA reductase n=1 Tax=Anaerococcus hydrogenalis TaxID=33029 RepID=UPI0029018C3D|nr:glutamyl-tRNA reductase [Anaerococcus hydrogenalis]MDU1315733.1 glutamyl-tRNA reductase [Anaerococcus hydrogenalis]
MFFYSFGLNHHRAGIDVREKVHFKDSDIIEASEILENYGFEEVVILSTCNRSEIFALSSENKFSNDFFVEFFENYFSIDDLSPFIFVKKDLDAINHLFSLTCGLDSLIVGEDQILGQVSDAYETSLSLGFCKKILSEAFKRSINLSKKIKSDSNISHIPLSLPYISVKKAQEIGNLSNKNALVVGIGNIGKLCIENLMETGANIYISNWNMDKSIKMQKEYENINIISYEKIQENLEDMDYIFSATSSPHLVLKKDYFKNIKNEINIFDLALPRDCDPEISNFSNIKLFDVDSIKDISRKNLDKRRTILQSYKANIDKKSKEFYKWMKEVKIDYILKDLNDRCDDLADKTMDYIFRKTDMTASQKKKVDKAVRNALKKIARDPVLTIKENHDEDFDKTLKILTKVYKK